MMQRQLGVFLSVFFFTHALHAVDEQSELDALKAQAAALSQRIEAYASGRADGNRSDAVATKAAEGYITDDAAGSNPPVQQRGVLEMSSADTVLSVGGRIDMQSIFSWPEGSYIAGKIPLETSGENGQLTMSARDSRLWVKTRTPTQQGPVRTLIEVDFLGTKGSEATSNPHALRLRHAYLEAAGFTIGQTNSAFNSLVTLDTIRYPLNYTLVRQPLIRYSVNDRLFGFDLSFEQPETTLLDSNGTIIMPQDDVLPDVVARVRYYPEWGEGSFAVLGRYIAQDQATLSNGSVLSNSDSALGWGVNLSGKIRLWQLDDIRFDAQYGVGLGRYVAFNAFAAGSIDAQGNIDLQATYGGHLGYRHWWSPSWRSTLAFSYAGTQNNLQNIYAGDLGRVTRDVYGTQLNLLWIPLPKALVGLEYSGGVRRVESGIKGEIGMVTLLIRYDF